MVELLRGNLYAYLCLIPSNVCMLLPSLKEFQNNLDMNKIIQSWQETNNDQFGSIMLNEVLTKFRDTIEPGIDLDKDVKINIKLTRFNMTGHDSLVGKDKSFAYHKFQDMCNCTGTQFMHDQWGFSNSQRPDGMWRLDIMNMQTEHIIHTIPIFLETDSGNDAKVHQPRITAMKLWQNISCGHLIRETNFVCIMRLNVEMCSQAAFLAAANPHKYIMAHLAQLAYGSTLVIYSIIKHFVPKDKCLNATEFKLDKFAPDIEEHRKTSSIYEQKVPWDLHFYIGEFLFDEFKHSHRKGINPHHDDYDQNTKDSFKKCRKQINIDKNFEVDVWFGKGADASNYVQNKEYPNYYKILLIFSNMHSLICIKCT